MQHEMTVPGPLLDGRGRLAETGWAKRLVKSYDRAAIKAGALRIKEWDYYCVLNDRFGAAFTIADNGYMGLVSVSVLDLAAATEMTATAMLPFPLGSLKAPASSAAGDFCCKTKGIALRFMAKPGRRIIEAEWPGFGGPGGKRGLFGRIELGPPPEESIAMATPFAEKRTAFYYNQKINCMPASGALEACGRLFEFKPEESFAVLDWGRGVWPYANTWYWASCSSLIGKRSFGFNLGCGFGDTSAAGENAFFVDGRAHKLGDVEFLTPGRSFLDPWRMTDGEGRFDAVFTPILDRASDTNLLLLRSDQHQVFGRYSGKAVLDSGEEVEFRDLIGFAEKVRNKW